MVGVLEMNKSIFGSTFVEKKASRRARKAMAMDLIVPSNAVELTSEEMEYIDGGGTISLTITTGVFGNLLGMVAAKAIRGVGIGILASMISANVAAALNLAGSPFAVPTFGVSAILLTVAGTIVGSLLASKLIDMGVDAFLSWANLRPTLFHASSSNWFLPNFAIVL